jgi:SSS family solute:Na+ symporter
MVYITAVGPLVGFTLLNRRIYDRWANTILAIGGGMAIPTYLARWTGFTTIPETIPLTVSLLPLCLTAVLLWRHSTSCQENEARERSEKV